MTAWLAPAFFAIAFIYSTVGFGGGSSYLSLLALSGMDHRLMPVVSLICNLIVTSGGCYLFLRAGCFRGRLFWPFAVTSIPCAWVGAQIQLSRASFFTVLGLCLLLAGCRILHVDWRARRASAPLARALSLRASLGLGAFLGLLSGLVGIGGGIFLAPVLHNLNCGRPREIAASSSMFIWVNSVSSLVGHLQKSPDWSWAFAYWPAFVAVALGGQIGSRLAAGYAPSAVIRTLTALFTIFVGGRILIFN